MPVQIWVGERDKSERAIADVQVSILKVEEAIPADVLLTHAHVHAHPHARKLIATST